MFLAGYGLGLSTSLPYAAALAGAALPPGGSLASAFRSALRSVFGFFSGLSYVSCL